MSSTDIDARAAAVLDGAVARARGSLEQRGVRFFPMGPDAAAPTYFEPPRRAKMTKADFELEATASPEAFIGAVRALWEAEGLPELCAVADELLPIARDLAEEDDDATEVSPFVYAMF